MTENFDDFDITKAVHQYISEKKITIEEGLDLVHRYTVMATLEMNLWDIETAIENRETLKNVKEAWEVELDDAEKDYNELTKKLNVDI